MEVLADKEEHISTRRSLILLKLIIKNGGYYIKSRGSGETREVLYTYCTAKKRSQSSRFFLSLLKSACM